MSEKISATVYWNGRSTSGSNGEHIYNMEFTALPRVGDSIEVGYKTVKVAMVLFTSSGNVHIFTKKATPHATKEPE